MLDDEREDGRADRDRVAGGARRRRPGDRAAYPRAPARRPRLRRRAASAVRGLLSAGLGLTPADEPLVDEAVRARAAARLPARARRSMCRLRPTERTDRGRGARAAAPAGGDGRHPPRHARRHRLRVPARLPRRRAAHALGPARACAARSSPGRWPRCGPSSAGCSRSPATRATSTSTCSTSSRCARCSPSRCAPTSTRCCGVLRRRRLLARREMSRALRSARAERLRRDWAALLASLVERPVHERPYGARPIGEVSLRADQEGVPADGEDGRRDRSWRARPRTTTSCARRARSCATCSSCSACRCTTRRSCKPMIRALKGLQDVLGRHQDREVQIGNAALARRRGLDASRRRRRADGDGGADRAPATRTCCAARGEFAESFATFASGEQRRLVRETFA